MCAICHRQVREVGSVSLVLCVTAASISVDTQACTRGQRRGLGLGGALRAPLHSTRVLFGMSCISRPSVDKERKPGHAPSDLSPLLLFLPPLPLPLPPPPETLSVPLPLALPRTLSPSAGCVPPSLCACPPPSRETVCSAGSVHDRAGHTAGPQDTVVG